MPVYYQHYSAWTLTELQIQWLNSCRILLQSWTKYKTKWCNCRGKSGYLSNKLISYFLITSQLEKFHLVFVYVNYSCSLQTFLVCFKSVIHTHTPSHHNYLRIEYTTDIILIVLPLLHHYIHIYYNTLLAFAANIKSVMLKKNHILMPHGLSMLSVEMVAFFSFQYNKKTRVSLL